MTTCQLHITQYLIKFKEMKRKGEDIKMEIVVIALKVLLVMGIGLILSILAVVILHYFINKFTQDSGGV